MQIPKGNTIKQDLDAAEEYIVSAFAKLYKKHKDNDGKIIFVKLTIIKKLAAVMLKIRYIKSSLERYNI